MVELVYSKFQASHGKMPRGVGHWGFCDASKFDRPDYLDHVMWHTGSFADAKRMALAWFRGKAERVVVCP